MPSEVVPPLKAQSGQTGKGDAAPCVAWAFNGDQSAKTRSMGEAKEQAPSLRAGGPVHLATTMQVRRLTPTECSRLQGFPDDYLPSVAFRGKCPPADGSMYRALGNSMAVPVMRWIGERIMEASHEANRPD
ncbi:DNA cytosine methyltransferase [Patescibacteria group bacterium]|nr:DNA cytosine methyltransferase [Patescibacteria group bacterium]